MDFKFNRVTKIGAVFVCLAGRCYLSKYSYSHCFPPFLR